MTLFSPLPILMAAKAGLSKGRDPPAKEPSFAPTQPGGQAPKEVSVRGGGHQAPLVM